MHVVQAIANVQLQPRIIKRAPMHGRQPLARHVDDVAVQLGHDDALHAGVAQQVVGRAAVAAADDECLLRLAVRDGWQMHHGFMVEKFVLLRCHEATVNAHGAAKQRRLHNFNVLHGRAPLGQQFCGAQIKTKVGRELLDGEGVGRLHARTTRCRWGCCGAKACITALNRCSALAELSCR